MKKPEPQIGQIVRYDYLWREERNQGHAEGTKERPCAVIVALTRTEDGSQDVYMAPITHSPPRDSQPAIELSQFSSLTGLDQERSWLVLSELNRVSWSDPGIVPARSDRWLYGMLPRAVAKRASKSIVELHRRGALKTVDRVSD